jgi:predicted proteasome-type protease
MCFPSFSICTILTKAIIGFKHNKIFNIVILYVFDTVVADEVRKLAENSAKATESIKQSREAIQAETQRTVDSMGTARREIMPGRL